MLAMSAPISRFSKIFGSGPAGLLISLALFLVAYLLDHRIDPPPLIESPLILNTVLLVSILMTLAVIVWSIRSLPAAERGEQLATHGAYKYVRHPLYAAFLSIFNFGLAVYLNSYIFILWAILLHPAWHWVVRYEEKLMVDIFGQPYAEYRERTGRFFPRLRQGIRRGDQ